MIYKAGILGASGRVGLELCNLLAQGFQLGSHQLELGEAVGKTTRLKSIEGVPVTNLKESPRESLHVWIDFSRPEATLELLGQITSPIVIGTTGFTAEQRDRIIGYSKQYPVVLSSNMSVGMNVFFDFLQTQPIKPGTGFDVALSETHHKQKVDAPSGTAKILLDLLAKAGHEVQVSVVRAGDEKGSHSVRFIGMGEELEVSHRVWDRVVFARGALMAAVFAAKVPEPGLYSMLDVMKGSSQWN